MTYQDDGPTRAFRRPEDDQPTQAYSRSERYSEGTYGRPGGYGSESYGQGGYAQGYGQDQYEYQQGYQQQYQQPGYAQPGYQQGGYPQGEYQQPGYGHGGYQQQSSGQEGYSYRPSTGDRVRAAVTSQFDLARYCFSVVAVAIVAALTAFFVGWILDLILLKIADATDRGFAYTATDRIFYAVFGAVAALLAGLLWWALNVATSAPSLFYNWIVVLLVSAGVILPLLLNTPFYNGLTAAIMNLVVGLPVVYLIAPIGNAARRNA